MLSDTQVPENHSLQLEQLETYKGLVKRTPPKLACPNRFRKNRFEANASNREP